MRICHTPTTTLRSALVHSGIIRTLVIFTALAVGACVPAAHSFVWLIRWLIMGMLFFVFLSSPLRLNSLRKSHFVILTANIAMGFLGWGLGSLTGNHAIAVAGFFCGITPTATAAAVIISFLHRRVDYVVTSFLLTNLVIAALLPFLLPLVVGNATPSLFVSVAGSVSLVVFVPMALAAACRRLIPASTRWPAHMRNLSFAAWISSLFLVAANTSHFVLQNRDLPLGPMIGIMAISAGLCAVNFLLGWWIGGREFAPEASQSLGQKNNTFTLYLALTYANPLAAMGPACYVLWHNIWIAILMRRNRSPDTSLPD